MPAIAAPRPPQTETSTSRLDDPALLLAVRAGDPGAYAELYARYASEVRRYARRLVRSDDVEDVVADSFTKVLQALRRGRGPVDHPERYLMVTVRTTALGLHARRAKHREVATRTVPEAAVDPVRCDDQLTAALCSLSHRWRLVLWLTEVEGWTPSDLGAELGLSADAAAALAYRARRALRLAYEALEANELDER